MSRVDDMIGIGLLGMLGVLVLTVSVSLVLAVEQAPVDPASYAKALHEMCVKDRANAQHEAAYFAARTKALTEENEQLKAKVKELEPKKKEDKK